MELWIIIHRLQFLFIVSYVRVFWQNSFVFFCVYIYVQYKSYLYKNSSHFPLLSGMTNARGMSPPPKWSCENSFEPENSSQNIIIIIIIICYFGLFPFSVFKLLMSYTEQLIADTMTVHCSHYVHISSSNLNDVRNAKHRKQNKKEK